MIVIKLIFIKHEAERLITAVGVFYCDSCIKHPGPVQGNTHNAAPNYPEIQDALQQSFGLALF